MSGAWRTAENQDESDGLVVRIERWPELRRALLFGPFAPISFRLQGRDALPDAAHRFTEEAKASGYVQSSQLQESELQKLRH
jgi:dimethylaniline monooxygenase (N-oxide forming)